MPKLSQIASSPAQPVLASDTFIGVHGGNTDYQFIWQQLSLIKRNTQTASYTLTISYYNGWVIMERRHANNLTHSNQCEVAFPVDTIVTLCSSGLSPTGCEAQRLRCCENASSLRSWRRRCLSRLFCCAVGGCGHHLSRLFDLGRSSAFSPPARPLASRAGSGEAIAGCRSFRCLDSPPCAKERRSRGSNSSADKQGAAYPTPR